MGDDTACSVNDLPKVTSILKSEAISNTEAFDMMVRFLSKHQFQYPGNAVHNHNNPQQHEAIHNNDQDLELPRFGRVYHFWQDLYHVTETLAVRSSHSNESKLLCSQQQEILRRMRLVAAPIHTEILNDHSTSQINHESTNQEDTFRYADEELTKDVKVETVIKQEAQEEVQQKHRKSSKKHKKESKKDKKRKRGESTESP